MTDASPRPGVVTGGVFGSAAPASEFGVILKSDGILCASAPDNTCVVDADIGVVIWHYCMRVRGGAHASNKVLGANGLDGIVTGGNASLGTVLRAIECRTGKAVWERSIGPEQGFMGATDTGMLATADC